MRRQHPRLLEIGLEFRNQVGPVGKGVLLLADGRELLFCALGRQMQQLDRVLQQPLPSELKTMRPKIA